MGKTKDILKRKQQIKMKSNSENILELITALVDNELDSENSQNLHAKIKCDKILSKEYNIQLQIKNLLNERFSSSKSPEYLQKSILNRIKIENNISN